MVIVSKKLNAIITNINNELKQDVYDPEIIATYLNQLQDLIKGIKPSVRDVINLQH